MSPSVFDQVTLPGKGLGAHVATERFDAAVQFEVSLAIFLASEPFRADWARVGPVARVRAHVDVKVAAECKLFAAARLGAGEATALRVNADVSLQVGKAREGLVAAVASKRTAAAAAGRRGRLGRRMFQFFLFPMDCVDG